MRTAWVEDHTRGRLIDLPDGLVLLDIVTSCNRCLAANGNVTFIQEFAHNSGRAVLTNSALTPSERASDSTMSTPLPSNCPSARQYEYGL
jgi:hypothetical protein